MIRPKLIALASAGILTLATFAGCVGEDKPTATLAPTHTPIVTEAPDPGATMPPASTISAQIARDPTSTPSGIMPIDQDALKTVVAEPTATAAPTPTQPWPTRVPIPTITWRPTPLPTGTYTFVTPTPWPTRVPLPTAIRPTFTPRATRVPVATVTPAVDIWTQLAAMPQRGAEVYAHYDLVINLIVECGLPESVLDQVESDPDILAGVDLQMNAYQVLIEVQAEARTVDFDNPGAEGYETLFRLLSAYNEYYRTNRELLTIEKAIYESHDCPMPPNPDWMAAL